MGFITTTFSFTAGYPFSDVTIARSYEVRIGSNLTMNCTIPMGLLKDRYSVQWFDGLNLINMSSHLKLDGFVLIFSNVKESDFGMRYSCRVTLRRKNNFIVTRQGAIITLRRF